jgi:hypothetical protein
VSAAKAINEIEKGMDFGPSFSFSGLSNDECYGGCREEQLNEPTKCVGNGDRRADFYKESVHDRQRHNGNKPNC